MFYVECVYFEKLRIKQGKKEGIKKAEREGEVGG